MSGFDLVPVEGGKPIHLPPGETVIGRGPFLRVSPKKKKKKLNQQWPFHYTCVQPLWADHHPQFIIILPLTAPLAHVNTNQLHFKILSQ